eukprot:TRINITY_DN46986_c0_g1_i1.p1 TRINITY_DN46986_c0_g1~~TRINITY_DN46986_c0_g1_i1.p1  ORF type:complete len:225 (+),score=52.42 TRINITY_DN46986_c0_g1_i1:63-737(+)
MSAMEAGKQLTIIGFGSLLSEKSARSTFPDLTNFRLARVHGYCRVFRHPAGIFFERGIVPQGSMEFSSLSVEPAAGRSIVVAVFETAGLDLDALQKREEEYDLVTTPYQQLDGLEGNGLMCLPLKNDREGFVQRWGEDRFEQSYGRWGLETIWGFGSDSGILPCPVYLRHCVLAAAKAGEEASNSFLDVSFLADRKTSIRQYLEQRPDIMQTQPPESLINRYNG